MANNFDESLNKINKFITLKDTDRCSYATDFNAVCDFLIEQLRANDSVFHQLHNGNRLCGSYADHLKISKPNEYDVNIILKLRNYEDAIIINDSRNPGYININITNILNRIKGEIHNLEIYCRLLQFIDHNGFLVQEKISSWFQSLINSVLNKCENTFTKNHIEYNLKYKKSGPAHTIMVYQNGRKIDIDFVPAFLFDKNQWIAERPCPNWIDNSEWTAIPKPIKKWKFYNTEFRKYNKNNNYVVNNKKTYKRKKSTISFRTSYVEIERELINNKNNLKNTLKMMKKLRDHQNITNLKSYYIKTVYLWENDQQSPDFCNKRPGELLIHMCQSLLKYLHQNYLPFFWDTSENMLEVLTDNEIYAIHDQIKSITNKLEKCKDINPVPNSFYQLFLTWRELSDLNDDETIIKDMERKYNNTNRN